ncbi:MAG: hypothetical protein AAGI37_19675 [Planctomycetota bacterium]
MEQPTSETTEADAGPPRYDAQPQVGLVELDRFCSACGYNLRQQPVRREPTTGLLLCKCPECGSFEPANQAMTRQRSWFAQLVYLLWLVWIAVLGTALAGAISATINLSHDTGEMLNETKYLDEPIEQEKTDGSTRTINFQYQVSPLDGQHTMQLVLNMTAAYAIAAGLLSMLLLFVPHWPRKGYVLLALGWPAVALLAFYGMRIVDNYTLDYATRGLKLWIFCSPLLLVLFAIAGGLTAVYLCRPIARFVVRVVVPSRQRGPFAYLWLVDGKAAPQTK